ncbi:MAG: antitoxin, partial [Chloroflexi bacterium]|nr:antitoxin [Chloroflexota bacterium]
MSPMKATIDSAGRLVIPSSVRRQAGLRPGMPLDLRYRDGVIEVEPAPLPVRL